MGFSVKPGCFACPIISSVISSSYPPEFLERNDTASSRAKKHKNVTSKVTATLIYSCNLKVFPKVSRTTHTKNPRYSGRKRKYF